jgi:hypothetical protein
MESLHTHTHTHTLLALWRVSVLLSQEVAGEEICPLPPPSSLCSMQRRRRRRIKEAERYMSARGRPPGRRREGRERRTR